MSTNATDPPASTRFPDANEPVMGGLRTPGGAAVPGEPGPAIDVPVILAVSRRSDVESKLLMWFVFGVVIGLFPLWALTLKQVLSPEGASWTGVLRNGELFIASAVIAAGAIGEILFVDSAAVGRKSRILGGGSCLVACLMNGVAYAVMVDAKPAIPASHIMWLSLVLFGLTIVASAFCIGLVAGR